MKWEQRKCSEQNIEPTGREVGRSNPGRGSGAEPPSLFERKEKPHSLVRTAAAAPRGAGENTRHHNRPSRGSKRGSEDTERAAEIIDGLAKQANVEKEQRRAEIYAINSLMR